MSQKKYWKSLNELHNTSAYQESVQNEFNEPLPFEEDGSLLEAPTQRRDFLKYLGFSTAAVTLAASCQTKVRNVLPYAIKPNDITPGVAKYYASSFVDAGEVIPVVIKNRDGRPIKIEGNSLSKVTEGATHPRVQASVLNLYDTNRLRFPRVGGITGKEASWQLIDDTVKSALTSGKTALVTTSLSGPSNMDIVNKFLSTHSNVEHVIIDPVSYSGILQANETGGKKGIPYYRFDKAKTIVSIGADFLSSWVSPAIFAKQYGKGRKISAKNQAMSKHYQFEGMMSVTGANADERYTCRASQYGLVALALLDAINGTSPSISGAAHLNNGIQQAANALKQGNGLVVCGSNDAATQSVVNAINSAIGAYGTTIDAGKTFNFSGSDSKVEAFANNLGTYSTVIFADVNPVYTYGKTFANALAKVKNKIAIADRPDETTSLCDVIIPMSHFLESWGDAETVSGQVSFIQPAINPIFKSRTLQECLLKWSGSTENHEQAFKNYWNAKSGSDSFNTLLQNGLHETEDTISGGGATGNVESARASITSNKSGEYDLVIYNSASIGYGGNWSNNPWLQEMPDPITRATWDNYVMMSPVTAKAMGGELNDQNEVVPDKKVFSIKTSAGEIKLPVMVIPGMHDKVVAVANGYGRAASVGLAAANLGVNVNEVIKNNNGNRPTVMAATVSNTGDTYPVAQIQTHQSYEGRHSIVREFSIKEFTEHPDALREERYEELKPLIKVYASDAHAEAKAHDAHGAAAAGAASHAVHDKLSNGANSNVNIDNFEEEFRREATLYPTYDSPGAKWGMSIDLNSCIGCGACTIACQAENNISVVGKKQVMLMHDMEWIRIDRYFSGNPNDPDSIETVFQPMICQHCDNAPCENVCPVNATNHSSEGLNQMAYNRCIGTRYCANNCPFKVRRFNWRDWNGADSFKDNLYTDGRRDEVNDELTRMVLNPDVVVRSRGVMEKCSFCAQRLQAGKLQAKKDNRPLSDADVVTACQQSCPTNAIVFGNVNDPESAISQLRKVEQKERLYYALEEIHVLPNVNYLSKIRNKETISDGTLSKHSGTNSEGHHA